MTEGCRGRATAVACAVVLTGVGLAACSGPDDEGSPSVTSPTSSGPGQGSATVTLGDVTHDLDVTCVESRGTKQASGASGNGVSVTVLLRDVKPSAVLIERTADGTTIFQAADGFVDDTGLAVGEFALQADGTTYAGEGTFVVMKLDKQGKRVMQTTDTTRPGSVSVTCDNGFASPNAAVPQPRPTTPTSSPM